MIAVLTQIDMKKILLVLIVIAFIGCEKDKFKVGEDDSFVNLTMKFDTDGDGVKCKVYLFDIESKKFDTNYYVNFSTDIPLMLDVNGDVVMPVYSSYKVVPSKAPNGKYINETKHTIYRYELLAVSPTIKNFLLVVDLLNGGYQYSVKPITWNSDTPVYLSKTFTRSWTAPTLGHNREAW